jgi:hypothetical protein
MYLTPVRAPAAPQQAYCSDRRAGRDDKAVVDSGTEWTVEQTQMIARVDGNESSKRVWLEPDDSAFRPPQRRIGRAGRAAILDARLNSRDIELWTCTATTLPPRGGARTHPHRQHLGVWAVGWLE